MGAPHYVHASGPKAGGGEMWIPLQHCLKFSPTISPQPPKTPFDTKMPPPWMVSPSGLSLYTQGYPYFFLPYGKEKARWESPCGDRLEVLLKVRFTQQQLPEELAEHKFPGLASDQLIKI